MCYAIPGKTVAIDKKIVTVEYFGETKKAVNELDDLKIGDYIYAQGGYVIKKISKDEAESTLKIWKETFFELQEKDLSLSKIGTNDGSISKYLLRILDKASDGRKVTDSDLLYLLDIEKEKELELLYKTANFIRQKHLSNSCCVHGIIEFSNYCSKGCRYCGISYHNKTLNRYRMSKEQLCETAYEAIEKYGFKTLVLQSGEDSEYSAEDLAEIIVEIKKRSAVLIFVSVGEVGIDGLKKLYKAGARGLLMRFETSNSELYKKMHPDQNLEDRLTQLKAAYEMGYMIITGSLIGIPGQTNQDVLNDIKLTKTLNAEMYSFGPFVPHPDTPFNNIPVSSTKKIMKALAISRIIDPESAKILVTTAFETINKEAREQGLMAGANSVMLNVTPDDMKKDYSIYPDRAHCNEDIVNQIDQTLSLLRNLGRAPTDLGINEQIVQ